MNLDVAGIGLAGLDGLQALRPHFLRPYWLSLLLALPLLAWWWQRRRRRQSVWRDAVDPHLLPHLLQGTAGARGRGVLWLGLLSVGLGICALAGPSWQQAEQALWQSRAPVVIALDLSRTITAGDLPPSRLAQARAKIARLLRERAGGQVALVAFAGDAYTVAPLTDDGANVALFLDALAPDIMPSDSTPSDGMPSDGVPPDSARGSEGSDDSRAGRAIAWSSGLLRQAGFDHGDIVLLTDHADGAARDAAVVARKAGYRVSALGLGTARGTAYRDAAGGIAQTRLDAASLRALAAAGGGGYAALAAGDGDLRALGLLDPRQAGTVAAHGEKARVWRDQGYWLLLPLMLLAAFAFRRGGALAALLLCLLLPLSPAHAAELDVWRRPDQQRHRQFEQGVQAYRNKDYAAAEKLWDRLPGAEAAYNRGNALAEQGDYDAAVAQYDEALKLHPGMADAIANKKAVLAAKKRQQASGTRQKPGQKPGKCKPGDKGCDRKPGDPDDRQKPLPGQPGQAGSQDRSGARKDTGTDQDDNRQSPTGSSDPDKAAPDQPSDAEAQRKADAAQRTRMQQALAGMQQAKQDRQGGQQAALAAEPDETPAERERRIANEAWLRRVPDDPGGLLRARFQLEYQRRQRGGR